jgi:hypothetical protein
MSSIAPTGRITCSINSSQHVEFNYEENVGTDGKFLARNFMRVAEQLIGADVLSHPCGVAGYRSTVVIVPFCRSRALPKVHVVD